jgi:hypothetical protein
MEAKSMATTVFFQAIAIDASIGCGRRMGVPPISLIIAVLGSLRRPVRAEADVAFASSADKQRDDSGVHGT